MREKMNDLLSAKKVNKNYRWSIRKLSTGAASIIVGASIIFGSTVPVFASMTDTSVTTDSTTASSETVTTNAPSETTITTDSPAISTQTTSAPPSEETLSAPTAESLMAPSAETLMAPAAVTTAPSAPVDPKADPTVKIDAPDGSTDILIKTTNAKTVTATFQEPGSTDKNPITLTGSAGSYTYPRPAAGGTIEVTATGQNGVATVQSLVIQATTVDGVIIPTDPTLNLVNDIPVNGTTDPGKAEDTNVRIAGVEFLSQTGTGQITLKSESWTNFAEGWKKDPTLPLAGKFVINFQDPKFYENIESIVVNGVSFTREENGSLWYVDLNIKTFDTGQIGSGATDYVTINMKTSKSLDDPTYGINGKPITYTTAWVTGTDYKYGINTSANEIVAESIDQSWFSTSMPNYDAAKKANGAVDNGYTGTNFGELTPTLKALPVIDANGAATAIKLVYAYRPTEYNTTPTMITSLNTVPYINQVLPTALMPYIDKNNVYIYQSDASGLSSTNLPNNRNPKAQKLQVVMNDNLFDTRETDSLTISDTVNPTRADVDATNKTIRDNILGVSIISQWAYYTVEYNLNPTNAVELAKQLNATIIANNEALTFEGWMGRETPAYADKTGNQKPGIFEGSYANAFFDTNLLTVNAPMASTISTVYPSTVLNEGEISQSVLPTLTDIQGRVITVPPGTTFSAPTSVTGLSSITIDSSTGAITAKAATGGPFSGVSIPVTVTFSDGATATVNAPFTINSPDASTYDPVGQNVSTTLDVVPDASTAIRNSADLPEDTQYEWKVKPDVTTPGTTVPGIVVVKYPDGTSEEVPVSVIVANQPMNTVNEPEAVTVPVETSIGTIPSASTGINNKDQLPAGTTYTWQTPPNVSQPGDVTGTILVTYPDNTTDTVTVPVKVIPNADNVINNPVGMNITTDVNKVPFAEDAISNKIDLNNVVSYAWETTPDVSAPRTYPANVVVTYADGTKDIVPVYITVKAPSNSSVYDPIAQDLVTPFGVVPTAASGIENTKDMPNGTTYAWETQPTVTTAGTTTGNVRVTYPDGSSEIVPVNVTVNAQSLNQVNSPVGQNLVTNVNEIPNASTAISNKDTLTGVENYTWEINPDVSVPGTYPANVVVTYTDETTDIVPVYVTVKAPAMNTVNDPLPKDLTTPIGVTPSATSGIANSADMPAGTTYIWQQLPKVDVAGNTSGVIQVTYPDGTTDLVPVNVTVSPAPMNIENAPSGQNLNTTPNVIPAASKAITNQNSLPEGTEYSWVQEPVLNTVGTYPATVLVTYTDGSTDQVPIYIIVNNPVVAVGQTVTVKVDEVPSAESAISNIPELPAGTSFDWKVPPVTSESGTYDAVVVVSYPDGTIAEVPVKIVVEKTADNELYSPNGINLTTPLNVVPTAESAIANTADMPAGTSYLWQTPPVVSSPGTVSGVVVVTYPDSTKDNVPVQITVLPEPNNVTYTPSGQNVTTEVGVVPPPSSAISNKEDLPQSTSYTWKETPAVDESGTVPATVLVTYPDGTVDEVQVNIEVAKQADSVIYAPEGQNITTPYGIVPNASDIISNKTDLPTDTTYIWKSVPDVKTSGSKPATVIVTYPDGTKEEVTANVTVQMAPLNTLYDPTGQNVTTPINTVPAAASAIANISEMPSGTTFRWEVIPDVSQPGSVPSTVIVTYIDGTRDFVPVTVFVESPALNSVYEPVAKDIHTPIGVVPSAVSGISNAYYLPSGTKYVWETDPIVSAAGTVPGYVTVIYPDNTTDKTLVNVIVDPTVKTADTIIPETVPVNTNVNGTPPASDAITNKDTFPTGTTIEWTTPPDTTIPGTTTGVITITYPDGSQDVVNAEVNVTAVPTDADKYTPNPTVISVLTNESPAPELGLTNEDTFPSGTTIKWTTPPNTSVPGDTTGVVTVTYPDGSKDVVTIPVKVSNPLDNTVYNPEGNDLETVVGTVPAPELGIANKDFMPVGTKYSWEQTPPVAAVHLTSGVVKVTYPDSTFDLVNVFVNVVADKTMADIYTPEIVPVTVAKNEKPTPESVIGNEDTFPAETTIEWVTPPDTSNPGDVTGEIKVTYPDGSIDTVPVTITVKDTLTMADSITPEVTPISTNLGGNPPAQDGVGNEDTFPEGTTISWETVPDTSLPSETIGIITITYPDGSTDTVTVPVIVKGTPTYAEMITPSTQNLSTEVGGNPAAEDAIINKNEMPKGTTFEWQNPLDTSKPGNYDENIVVTYPDGSVDIVAIKLTVNEVPLSDSEKYQPAAENITVETGTPAPLAETVITNMDTLPQGTTATWKVTPDTSKSGEIQATIVVTYPDKTTDEISVTITVADKVTQADTYTPVAQEITVKVNELPEPVKGINLPLSNLPDGTTYDWAVKPDTSKPGTTTGVVTVTYPDGSKENVIVTVNVAKNPTMADTTNPVANPIVIKPGDSLPDAITGVDKGSSNLPDGTIVNWVNKPDTSKEGSYTGTVEIVYPDGSKETLNVPVIVKADESKDNAKYQPEVIDIAVNVGTPVPPAVDLITNMKDLPKGTTADWKSLPDTQKPGIILGRIIVTYPDGSTDEVLVIVTIKDKVTMADKYTPVGQDIVVKVGGKPEAISGINLPASNLPEGTKFIWSKTPSTTATGETTGIITVIYPDGSTENVTVKVIVKEDTTMAETNNPVVKPIIVKPGSDLPDAETGIDIEASNLPKGTGFEWIKKPDTSKEGTYSGIIKVTYPDGSSEEVCAVIIVKAESKVEKPSNPVKQSSKSVLPETGAESATGLGTLGFGLITAGLGIVKGILRRKKND